MRLIRYNVAASLDGYIGPDDDSTTWITHDPSIDFAALHAQFDTYVMGRRTYEVMQSYGDQNPLKERLKENLIVVSRTLQSSQHPGITIVGDDFLTHIRNLKEHEGKDIWLFGGGRLFGACLDAGLVDRVEVAIIPVLLRGGIKLASDILPVKSTVGTRLELDHVQKLEESGIVLTVYKVNHDKQGSH